MHNGAVKRFMTAIQAFGVTSAILVAGCTTSIDDSAGTPSTAPRAAEKAEPDPIVGKWKVYSTIGTSDRNCSMDFSESAFREGEGRVWTVACTLGEGLGGINGVRRVSGWKREGGRIILSGIATPDIGEIRMPRRFAPDRVQGRTNDDIRFTLVRN